MASTSHDLSLKIIDMLKKKKMESVAKNRQINYEDAPIHASNLFMHPEVSEYCLKYIRNTMFWINTASEDLEIFYYYGAGDLDHVIVKTQHRAISICVSHLFNSGLFIRDENNQFVQWHWKEPIIFQSDDVRMLSIHTLFRHTFRDDKSTKDTLRYFSPYGKHMSFPWTDIIKPLRSNTLFYSHEWIKVIDERRLSVTGSPRIKINSGKLYTTFTIDSRKGGILKIKTATAKVNTLYPCKFSVDVRDMKLLGRIIKKKAKQQIKKKELHVLTEYQLDVIPCRLSSIKGWAYTVPLDHAMYFFKLTNYSTKYAPHMLSDKEAYGESNEFDPERSNANKLKVVGRYVQKCLEECRDEVYIDV
jgi:hypothetical protein